MFWLGEDSFERVARISMTRVEFGVAGEPGAEQSGCVENASWIQKGQAHYLMYEGEWDDGSETDDAAHVEPSRTIWKLEPSQVTLIRHGFVRWTLRFLKGQTLTSTGYLGETPLPVEVFTKEMSVRVNPQGGEVRLVWDASFGGSRQSVSLGIHFDSVER